jgi:hypothetical protein
MPQARMSCVVDLTLPLAESGQTFSQWLVCGMDVFALSICATCCQSNCGTGNSSSRHYVIVESVDQSVSLPSISNIRQGTEKTAGWRYFLRG